MDQDTEESSFPCPSVCVTLEDVSVAAASLVLQCRLTLSILLAHASLPGTVFSHGKPVFPPTCVLTNMNYKIRKTLLHPLPPQSSNLLET